MRELLSRLESRLDSELLSLLGMLPLSSERELAERTRKLLFQLAEESQELSYLALQGLEGKTVEEDLPRLHALQSQVSTRGLKGEEAASLGPQRLIEQVEAEREADTGPSGLRIGMTGLFFLWSLFFGVLSWMAGGMGCDVMRLALMTGAGRETGTLGNGRSLPGSASTASSLLCGRP